MARLRWVTLPLAVSAFVLLRGMSEIAPGGDDEAFNTALTFVIYLNRWSWLLLVLGWGHRWLNRPMAWLNYANRGVYPWYVLHQTVIVVAGVWLSGLGLGPVGEPVVLVLLAVLGCAGGMYLVERWVPWLGVGVGLKSRRSSPRVRAVTCGAYTANEPTLESGRS